MMENKEFNVTVQQGVPDLLAHVQSNVSGFDVICSPRSETLHSKEAEVSAIERRSDAITMALPDSPFQVPKHKHSLSVSISMPGQPTGFETEGTKEDADLWRLEMTNAAHRIGGLEKNSVTLRHPYYSQPLSGSSATHFKASQVVDISSLELPHGPKMTRSTALRDRGRYDSFKTFSGKLERQLTNLRGKSQEQPEPDGCQARQPAPKPKLDRYYDALGGPELDKLKPTEELALPHEKWPFLLRFPVSAFGMCLGVGSQAILWKTIATSAPTNFLHVPLTVNLVLWFIALALFAILAGIYALKLIFYFEAVRREYYHPIRVNFFFAPWIACLFLAIGVPPSVAADLPPALWYVLMTPILCLELKIYGQWMSGGQRRLSKVANPSNHLSIVGNFVGALLGANMGLKEGPIFFFAVGLAHYIVLFITLYQRLPTNETLPKELHPVFFLFVAAPSVACMAWAKITGEFGYGSRIAYFIALFLYASLAVRVKFFIGFRFSLAWWAYTFPMTGAAIATIRYATEVNNIFTQGLCTMLLCVASLAVTALLITTIIHAFVLRNLFPNDVSIAITAKKIRPIRALRESFIAGLENKVFEAYPSENRPLETIPSGDADPEVLEAYPSENRALETISSGDVDPEAN